MVTQEWTYSRGVSKEELFLSLYRKGVEAIVEEMVSGGIDGKPTLALCTVLMILAFIKTEALNPPPPGINSSGMQLDHARLEYRPTVRHLYPLK